MGRTAMFHETFTLVKWIKDPPTLPQKKPSLAQFPPSKVPPLSAKAKLAKFNKETARRAFVSEP